MACGIGGDLAAYFAYPSVWSKLVIASLISALLWQTTPFAGTLSWPAYFPGGHHIFSLNLEAQLPD
jgi:hypothetical protein